MSTNEILGLFLAALTLGTVSYGIIKKYKSQSVLLAGGLFLLFASIALGLVPKGVLPKSMMKFSSNSVWFDVFVFIRVTLSSRAAELGLLIMVVTGFARYMDKIGASRVLVFLAIKPLHFFKRYPYFVLSLGFVIGQLMHMVVPSASGLGVLLMVTMYPILISFGISKITATAMIATNSCLDLGPASGNTVLAAKNAGLPVMEYFMSYQLPIALAVTFGVAILHFFVARYFEAKYDGGLATGQPREIEAEADSTPLPPLWYVLLPLAPLILIFVFGFKDLNDLLVKHFGQIFNIKLDIIECMFVGLIIAMMAQYLATRNLKDTFASVQVFFDGMAKQFAVVVTLIVAGETFARGLTTIGAVDALIHGAESIGLAKTPMILVMSLIIMACTLVMGSGNAPFFSFAALAPEVAKKMGFESVNLLLPMQLTASVTRSVSPITAVVVAVCGISNVSPFEVVKRTSIPMFGGFIMIQAITIFLFGW